MRNIFPIILLFTLITSAQVTNEGQPLSWSYSTTDLEVVDSKTLPTFDLKSIQEEDKVNDLSFDKPWRFGFIQELIST